MTVPPLPATTTLLLERQGWRLDVVFNRPEARNAMSLVMVEELIFTFAAAARDPSLRAIVMRGSGRNFCAGADLKDVAMALQASDSIGDDPLARVNRTFGHLLTAAQNLPQALIALVEGSVLGGGLGLVAVSDIAIVHAEAKFRMPEVTLGLPPAQIAPFLVRRLGLTQMRRLAVTAGRFDGAEAVRLGLAHFVEANDEGLRERLSAVMHDIRMCAPEAMAATKALVMKSQPPVDEALLDEGARLFARCARSGEGREGTAAFLEKRKAQWVRD